MKILKIVLQDEKSQEIVLSTDEKRKINFIIGNNGSGKSIIFNKIKSFFSNEKKCKIIFDKNQEIQNPELMFLDFDEMYKQEQLGTIFKNKNFTNEQLYSIKENAEKNILRVVPWCFREDGIGIRLTISNGSIIIKNNTLAASENILVLLSLFISIRNQLEPEIPLIIDNFVERMSFENQKMMMEFLLENNIQLLVFCKDAQFSTKIEDELSMYEFLKESNSLGKMYQLENHILKNGPN